LVLMASASVQEPFNAQGRRIAVDRSLPAGLILVATGCRRRRFELRGGRSSSARRNIHSTQS
jgi:hypothetical protein